MNEIEKNLLESMKEAHEIFSDGPVTFWRTREEYGCLGNFSKHSIMYHGAKFKTSEHLYQALKMTNAIDLKRVQGAKTPKEAKNIAHECEMRSDWEEVKFSVMIDVLRLKYAQHEDVRKAIEKSGKRVIEEISPYDYIWGTGKDGSGQNLLGKAWMQVRKETNQ